MSAVKKLFYTMSEVCELLDIPDSTVRFWEREFKEIKPKRNAKGNRLFSSEDIENLKLIRNLVKDRKMTIAGAKEVIKSKKKGAKRELNLMDTLQKIRGELLQLMQDIEASDEEISRTIKVNMEQPAIQEEERYTMGSLFNESDYDD